MALHRALGIEQIFHLLIAIAATRKDRVGLESGQTQGLCNRWNITCVGYESSEVTCDQLRDEKTICAGRQAYVDVLDLPVVLGDPRQ